MWLGLYIKTWATSNSIKVQDECASTGTGWCEDQWEKKSPVAQNLLYLMTIMITHTI